MYFYYYIELRPITWMRITTIHGRGACVLVDFSVADFSESLYAFSVLSTALF